MVVYADLIFLLNSLIDFLLLWLTSGIRKQKTSLWRIALAAAVGGIYSMLYLWANFEIAYFFPVKILVSLVMIWIAYGYTHPLAYLRNLGVFYLICFITGGGMIALHYVMTGDSQVAGGIFFAQSSQGWGVPVSWLLLIFGFPLVWLYTRFSLRSLHQQQATHTYLAPVKIKIEEAEIACIGLIDTGNQLRDPLTRSPVMMVELAPIRTQIPAELRQMVEEKDWEQGWTKLPPTWMTRIRIIPYRVAGKEQEMMIAFKPDHVEILHGEKWNNVEKVLIGIDVGSLSSDGTYQAIIHPSCLSIVS